MATGKRVLVVDDDPDFREAVALALKAHGYEVIAAASGEEAVAALSSGPVAAAVVDMMMEEPDAGTMVTAELRRQPQLAGTPVILVTGVTQATGFVLPRGIDPSWLGADAWFDKPVDPARLVEKIEELTTAERTEHGPASSESGAD